MFNFICRVHLNFAYITQVILLKICVPKILLGLPLALTSEEAALLVEKGICKLMEYIGLNDNLTDEAKQKIKELEERYAVL